MKQARKLAVALAVGAAFISTAGVAQAQSALVVDFNTPTYFEFRGSFTYDGKVYGPSTAIANPSTGVPAPSYNSIDLEDFAADTLYLAGTSPKLGNDGTYHYDDEDETRGNAVVYRFYRQEYSGIAANLTKGVNNEEEERQHFVKAVVGEGTEFDNLASAGTYNYSGVAFSNFPQGTFSYTVDLANKKGNGSFTLDGVKVPGSVASQYYPGQFPNQFYMLNVSGVLGSGDITTDANDIAVVTGAVSAGAAPGQDARLYDAITQASQDAVNPVYNLTFFGPEAEEVAGRIQGLPDRIGGVAIIGKR